MLPSELLIHRPWGESVQPKRLALGAAQLALATTVIEAFQACQGLTQGDLDRRLQELEGDRTDYRIHRGLAHLLRNHFSTFAVVSPLEPGLLRSRLFALASQSAPSPTAAIAHLTTLAHALTQELQQPITPADIQQGLYADLKENHRLIEFTAPTPTDLIHRYNLAQVQGIFYRASQVVINAHRNDPGEYKLLFRYLKLFRLMTYIEGDADHGFTITIDGPTSVLKASTRYGVDMAKLLPALLHVTRWSLVATLAAGKGQGGDRRFTLESCCDLVSHYPPGKAFDSMVEESFADSWPAQGDWRLEREVDLIPLPGGVMIPDFRLVHRASGRSYLLEIVGYWRSEYLRKKFAQVRKAQRRDLILAISERLNLEKAGVTTQDLPTPILWFKAKLTAKAILALLAELEP